MNKKDQQESQLWDRLESLVLEWQSLDTGDDAVRQRLNLEISEIMLAVLSPRYMDALGVFWLQDMGKYNPQKGNFRSFVVSRLTLRKKDLVRKEELTQHKEMVSDGFGGKKSQWANHVSLDAPVSEDSTTTSGDMRQDENAVTAQEKMESEEYGMRIISLILTLPQRLNRQANNESRISYFRMFFTDGAVKAIHNIGTSFFCAHERDLFRAMKLPFLDFFMEKTCRTLLEVTGTNLKDYGLMVPDRPMEKPKQPLPNDVYLWYMNTQEDAQLKSLSTITNQRKAYQAFVEENLMC